MGIGTVMGFVVGLALFLLSIVLATDNDKVVSPPTTTKTAW